MRPVVIIDANNVMHRDFAARPTAIFRGHNVNAVRAMRERVGRLRERFGTGGAMPAVVAVFDAGWSGREKLLPTYKAKREGTPPELAYQLRLARTYLPHYGCDTVEVPGFEADDVIATLVGPARAAGYPVYIVSCDKDLCALVDDTDPCVRVVKVGLQGLVDEAAVRLRFGVAPQRLRDLLALVGDCSDGIAGVPGIGPKTAAGLLQAHGSLEALLAHPENVERPRLRTLLETHSDAVRLGRRVVEPVCVPLDAVATGLTPCHPARPAPTVRTT